MQINNNYLVRKLNFFYIIGIVIHAYRKQPWHFTWNQRTQLM